MKKITISLLFVFVLLPTFAFSQAPTIDPITIPEAGANISYRCVDVQPVDGDQKPFSNTDPTTSRMFLAEGSGFEANENAYLITCFSSPSAPAPFNNIDANCTTGDATIDQRIGFTFNSVPNATRLAQEATIDSFNSLKQPIKVTKKIHDYSLLNTPVEKDKKASFLVKINADGKFSSYFNSRILYDYAPIIDPAKGSVESQVQKNGVRREVYGMFFTKADLTNPDQKIVGKNKASSLQYATIKFGEAKGSCANNTTYTDPKVLALDPTTGMSIPNVPFQIRYLKPGSAPVPVAGEQIGIVNPQSTGSGGWLSWYTSPDHYSLYTASSIISASTIPATSNITKLFSPLYTPSSDPSLDGDDIDETTGFVQVTALMGIPTPVRSPKLLGELLQRRIETMLTYRGEVDVPYAKVYLLGVPEQATSADRYGSFYLQVESTTLSSEFLKSPKLIIETQDLINTPYENITLPKRYDNSPQTYIQNSIDSLINKVKNILVKDALASGPSLEISLDPILPYLDGIAYDAQGKPIAFASVKVKLTSTNSTYYQTQADADGMFKFYPRQLPILPYYLEFSAPNSQATISQSTTVFVKKNEAYLIKENINLIAGTKQGTAVALDATIASQLPSQNTAPLVETNPVNTDTTNPTPAKTKNSKLYLYLFITLLVVSAPVLYWYFKKLTSSRQSE